MTAMYHQYRDLPQIPSISEDTQYGQWNDHTAYRQSPCAADNSYNYNILAGNGVVGMQIMERFLVEPAPLSQGLLQAKFHRSIPHHGQHYGQYEKWPTPELRYVSPDRESVSANSSYATHNEVRSPYHSDQYGSPEDFTQAPLPYMNASHMKALYAPEPSFAERNISLRDLQYDPEPEPERNEEDIGVIDAKIDTPLQSETTHISVDTPTEGYKVYSESRAGNSVRDAESVQPMSPDIESSSDTEYTPGRSSGRKQSSASNISSGRNGHRRRSHHGKKNFLQTTLSGRISKRPGRAGAPTHTTKAYADPQFNGDLQRHFPCPLSMYGCRSNFSSKNEWKRHMSTQHIKLGFWRCDLCPTSIDPHDDQTSYHNDFNRKDLFTQHLRRMHAAPNQAARNHKEYPVNEDNITVHQQRCFKTLRETPNHSQCLFCPEKFHGPTSWELRMEHIGRHLEKDRKAGVQLSDAETWIQDKSLEQWLRNEGIIALDKNGQWKIGDGRPQRLAASTDDEQSGEDI
ncbi:hypothetical protein CC80DRAFT_322595 [Byssothecium circinans]|uniref:C2H2-type domain-containing protein n=1 Tax=Byssothecium circinans TaxID=147558 RepID=A0A6A5UDJ4_9PLEO|nr:hypothetical protein CC80DRAFT_322595 [Byssothecium circinans]